ncbi:YbhB/YbcL family Raf kinase inhibitor-like protein [Candidatus Dojkabacteria bacterium]|nr:YbhB/YbcL family Raf kinase inhibitor-like protein [Candidatus Dojkabacteria bacterium]
MKVSSPSFINNGFIPSLYTCDGSNLNPELVVEEIPGSTKSLALIVDDPDAPMGIWTHWIVWNIIPKKSQTNKLNIPQGATPQNSVVGVNDFGNNNYDGPCPPNGTHRYFFRIVALDNTINIQEESNANDLQKAIEGHIIEQAQLIGLYQRI